MKKYNVIIILLFSVIFAEDIDILNLKNGDLIKGKIIENKINEYIRIELQGGSILTYTYDQIVSIEREEVNSNSSNSNDCNQSYQDGYMDGKSVLGGGYMLMGAGSGFLLGLIGTVVATTFCAAFINTEPPFHKLESLDKSCKTSYREGYRKGVKEKKIGSTLIGGMLGTVLVVVIIN